jgi:hypothetical protein
MRRPTSRKLDDPLRKRCVDSRMHRAVWDAKPMLVGFPRRTITGMQGQHRQVNTCLDQPHDMITNEGLAAQREATCHEQHPARHHDTIPDRGMERPSEPGSMRAIELTPMHNSNRRRA